MKINCCYPNCDICRVQDNCELKKPCNSKVLALEKEIAFELQSLKTIRRSISNMLTSADYYTLPYNALITMEHDTEEIIRELRKELKEEQT